MSKTRTVKFLVDDSQFSKIRLNARAKGHKTISSYMRDLALNRDISYEKMLFEIHREVVKNGNRDS